MMKEFQTREQEALLGLSLYVFACEYLHREPQCHSLMSSRWFGSYDLVTNQRIILDRSKASVQLDFRSIPML